MSSDSRVQVRKGDPVKDGRCNACLSGGSGWVVTSLWVIQVGDPEGHRVEIRLCDQHLAEVVRQTGGRVTRSKCLCHGPDMIAGVCPVHETPSPLVAQARCLRCKATFPAESMGCPNCGVHPDITEGPRGSDPP